MPPTTDKISENIPHDLYGTLVILTFLFTLAATLMLNDNLSKEWSYWVKPRPRRAEHITKQNSEPESNPNLIDVTKEDFEDWNLAAKHYYGSEQPFPIPENEWNWPKDYNPYKNPIKVDALRSDTTPVLPQEIHDKFMLNFKPATEAPAAAPTAAPAVPAAPAAPATTPTK